MQPFGHNRHGSKIGGCAPVLGRGAGSPVYHTVAWVQAYLPTKWHLDPSCHLATTNIGRKLGAVSRWGWGPACQVAKFHLDPSNRLATIHQRHRQDRTDRKRSDRIGRIVLQTVAQILLTEKLTMLIMYVLITQMAIILYVCLMKQF